MKTKSRNYYKGHILSLNNGASYMMQVYLNPEPYLVPWIADHIAIYDISMYSSHLGGKKK